MEKKDLLFALVCIPSRIALAAFAYGASTKQLKVLGFVALFFAFSNLVSSIVKLVRNKPMKDKNGEKYWWADIMPLHGILYAATAWLAFSGMNQAFVPLVLDVTMSAVARYNHNTGNK